MKRVLILSLRNLFLTVLLVINLFPLLWILMSSFKTNREILDFALSLPGSFSFKNYIRVFHEPGMLNAFLISVTVTGMSVIMNAAACFICAYAMSRFRCRFLLALSTVLAFGLLVPINSALLPIKLLMDAIHMSNSPFGLALLYTGIGVPISTLILKSHLMGIPHEIDEAALIDGAGRFATAFRIIMPIARPGLVTIMILQAVYVWNEFMFALTLIADPKYKTIQLITRNFLGVFQSNYGALFASVVISIVPVVVMLVLFQKRIVEAFASGALKG